MNETVLLRGAQAFLQNGLAAWVQSGIILALGLVAGYALRRRGPVAVALACRAALVGVGATVVFAALPYAPLAPMYHLSLPAAHQAAPIATPIVSDAPIVPVAPMDTDAPLPMPMSDDREPAAPSPPSSPESLPIAPVVHATMPLADIAYLSLAALWLLGTLAQCVWIIVCQLTLARLRRGATIVTDPLFAEVCRQQKIDDPPILAVSSRLRSPFLAGIQQATLFLPATYAKDFSPNTVRAIFAHELTHFTRQDCAWTLYGRLCAALLWPQPLLWLLLRQLEHAGEQVCDQNALTVGCPAPVYADCLLRLAEQDRPPRRVRTLAAGIVPFRSALARRIQQILERNTQTMKPITASLRLAVALCAALAVTTSLLLVSSHAAPPAPASVQPEAIESATHMKQLMLGMMMYVQDYDEKFPRSRAWGKELYPYIKDKNVFHDTLAPKSMEYGYAENRALNSMPLNRINAPASVVALFESTKSDFNANDSGESLARPGRVHTDAFTGNYYGFADGHVKPLSETARPSFTPSLNKPVAFPRRRFSHSFHPAYDAIQNSLSRSSTVTLTGHVLSAPGKPAALQTLSLSLTDGRTSFVTVTNNSGGYKFTLPKGLPASQMTVQVSGQRFPLTRFVTATGLTHKSTLTLRDIILSGHNAPRNSYVTTNSSGHVVPSAPGNAIVTGSLFAAPGIPNAHTIVGLRSEHGKPTYYTHTRADGQYRFSIPRDVASGIVLFHIAGRTFQINHTLVAGEPLTLPTIFQHPQPVPPLRSVTGVVKNADGTPAANVAVALRWNNDHWGVFYATTDASGAYKFERGVPSDGFGNPRWFNPGVYTLIVRGKMFTLLHAFRVPVTQMTYALPTTTLDQNASAQIPARQSPTMTGPGLIVTLNDSPREASVPPSHRKYWPYYRGNAKQKDYLIRDFDILMIVNELRSAHARDVTVNGYHLVGQYPIRATGPIVFVNHVPVPPPYIIRATGDPQRMLKALNYPGGFADQIRQSDPAMIQVAPLTATSQIGEATATVRTAQLSQNNPAPQPDLSQKAQATQARLELQQLRLELQSVQLDVAKNALQRRALRSEILHSQKVGDVHSEHYKTLTKQWRDKSLYTASVARLQQLQIKVVSQFKLSRQH